MSSTQIKIKPVGGVGQIGSNMTLIEYKSHRIMIDAGILFPSEDFFDLDYLIPDLTKVDPPDFLIITHGHEDHIGAIYNIVTFFPNIKIYAPRFAAALIRKKLEFNKHPFPITVYQENETLVFDRLLIDPIHVNHSIPDTFGLFFRELDLKFCLLFLSDFKIDFKTKYEKPFDFEKVRKLSSGMLKKLLLADSTNITSSTLETPSEFDLIDSFEKIISQSSGRIFITLFASNVHRIKTIIDLAEKYQYKLIPYGRSMISYIKTAQEEKIIDENEKVILSADSVSKTQENIIVLLSGCQADFLGTFRRVAMSEDSLFRPRSTDTFIISSKAIPGNEKKISMLTNKIAEIGCHIFTPSDLLIHVSGHPGKKDLTKLYNEFLPTDIVPIHGEIYFLREHIEHIKQVAPYAVSHFLLNNDEIHINEHLDLKIIQGEKEDPIIYHGKHIVIEKEKISERRKMACNGAVFLTVKVDLNKMKVLGEEYHLMGIPKYVFEREDHFKIFLSNELEKFNFKDLEKSKDDLRISIRRYFDNQIGYKPITVVHAL